MDSVSNLIIISPGFPESFINDRTMEACLYSVFLLIVEGEGEVRSVPTDRQGGGVHCQRILTDYRNRFEPLTELLFGGDFKGSLG